MVTISLCMVAGEKVQQLVASLETVKDIADEIVIINIDGREDVSTACSSFTKQVFYMPKTQDTAALYNYAFALANKEYVLWLEPGERLADSDRQKLMRLKTEWDDASDAIWMTNTNDSIEDSKPEILQKRPRMLKRSKRYQWQRGLKGHLPVTGRMVNTDISITQDPSIQQEQCLSIYESKLERSESLTAMELYYYAEKLFENELYDLATEYYEKFLKEKNGWTGDKISACYKLADLFREQGDQEKEIHYLFEAFKYDLPRAEFLCRLGTVFTERMDDRIAAFWYQMALNIEKPKDHLGFYKEECWRWFPSFKLCGCYYRLGEMEKAYFYNEKALEAKPGEAAMLHNKKLLEDILKKKQNEGKQKEEKNIGHDNKEKGEKESIHKENKHQENKRQESKHQENKHQESKHQEENRLTGSVSPSPSVKKTMKIVQVAPDVFPVPPQNYGGIESVVYEITEELVKRGHEVYLYAPKGSKTGAHLIPYEHEGLGQFDKIANFVLNTIPEGVDIIHDHTHISVLGKRKLDIPTICTIHGTINYRVEHPVFVSKRALEVIGGNHGFYVYNGLNLKEYEFSEDKQDYMLYLGRLDKMKGLHHALEIAARSKKRLVIAGPIHDYVYFDKEVKPVIESNANIEYIGSVGGKRKQEVIKHASCLLFPTSWEEPFGLVMIEAMACGTPVVALANGAVPEVLRGFPEGICQNVDEMVEKVVKGNYPSPKELRDYVIDKFTTEKMVDGYLEVYEEVINKEAGNKQIINKQERDADAEEAAGRAIPQTIALIQSKDRVKPLKILQVAPNALPCPPKDYGGIERVVYDLTEELVKKGHEVYLYAAEGSRSSGNLLSYDHNSQDTSAISEFVLKNLPDKVDVIHDHTHAYVMSQHDLKIPIVSTMHDSRKNTARNPVYLCRKALQNVGENQGFYAYNGINPSDYEFEDKKEDYMIFMGLLYSHKGINYALDVAERTGQKLVVAGPLYNLEYYQKEIEPRIKRSANIQYVGSVGGQQRQNLLKHARCMLFPTVWEEPFGLVMIEAMACGTPVLAFGNGAVPEVLAGFPELICRDADEMARKIQGQKFPGAAILRNYVINNFSASRMAEKYLEIYRKVME